MRKSDLAATAHSRMRSSSGPTATAAWEAFAHGVADWGIPARVMSDNGLCFTGRFSSGGEVDFERQLRALGVAHLPSSPSHPQTCGKLERSHQTTKRWLAVDGLADTEAELQDQLDRWRQHYNHHRPHSAAAGRSPIIRWLAQTPASPSSPLPGPRRTSLHHVSSGGTIGWGSYNIAVNSALAGQHVLVVAVDDELTVHGQTGIIRQLTIDRTRRYQPNGRPPGRPRH